MYTCIVRPTTQVRLICSWCMEICLRRAAHISAEWLISVQTDMQTDKRFGYEYGCGYEKQVCIYTSLLASRRSVNKHVLEASKVTLDVTNVKRTKSILLSEGEALSLYT